MALAAITTLRDDFNRADGALTAGQGWYPLALLSATIARVYSNQMGAAGTYQGAVRKDALGADQGVKFDVPARGSNTLGVWLRGTGLDLDNATTQGIGIYLADDGSYRYFGAWKYTDAGGFAAITEVDPYGGPLLVNGHTIQAQVIGNTFELYDGASLLQAVDVSSAGIASGEQIGFEFQAVDTRIDNVYSNTILPPSAGLIVPSASRRATRGLILN